MDNPSIEQHYVIESHLMHSNLQARKADKFEYDLLKAAIVRINDIVGWSHDNEKIFAVLDSQPECCYFVQLDNAIVGYAIVREEGEEKHLHVSWIATDEKGKGIGTLLMRKIIQKNKKLGHHLLTLYHRVGNSQLKRFYEKIALIEGMEYHCEQINPLRYLITYIM